MPTIHSSAKLNLFLEVPEKRPDGFHNIDSVFLELDLHDDLSARRNETGAITLICNDPTLPTDEQNLATKAAKALQTHTGTRAGLEMTLKKRIPQGGGLGGGSSNAAAALMLADRVWGTNLDKETMRELAAKLGSDVPFFLHGGTCLCRGRGEIITELGDAFPSDARIVLAMPEIHSNTAAAYKGLNLPKPGQARTSWEFIQAMKSEKIEEMEKAAFNRFEESVFKTIPELDRLRNELETLSGHPVRMSGSGATLWHFADKDYAESLPERENLSRWREENRVRLAAVGPAPTITGSGHIFLDIPSM